MKGNNIILVGFMGTGKSTVGRLLAGRLGWSFVDTDSYIVQQKGMNIPDLFRKEGEAAFRLLETEALRQVLGKGRHVVATGGGAVLAEMNRKLMLENGYVVTLHADLATIVDRVGSDTNRPLLEGNVEERVKLLMEQRKGAYDFADYILETTGLTPEQVVEMIVAKREEAV